MRERSEYGLFDTRHVGDAFSRAAASYEANGALQCEVAHQCVAALGSRLTCPNPLILDAGAGTGHVASHVVAFGLDWNLLALDISHPMCRLAARHKQCVVRGDMGRIPFRNDALDGVISSLALQWAPEPLTVFRQLAQVTRPGGWGVLSTFGPGTLRELAATFESIDGDPRVTPFPSRATLIELSDRAGWHVVRSDRQIRITQQESLAALMRSLKAIGATDRRSTRRRGLTGRDLFRKAAARYPADPGNPGSISATWEVVTITLQKPSR